MKATKFEVLTAVTMIPTIFWNITPKDLLYNLYINLSYQPFVP
jgi:hypothetical protein